MKSSTNNSSKSFCSAKKGFVDIYAMMSARIGRNANMVKKLNDAA
jgi:hypothetical protein